MQIKQVFAPEQLHEQIQILRAGAVARADADFDLAAAAHLQLVNSQQHSKPMQFSAVAVALRAEYRVARLSSLTGQLGGK